MSLSGPFKGHSSPLVGWQVQEVPRSHVYFYFAVEWVSWTETVSYGIPCLCVRHSVITQKVVLAETPWAEKANSHLYVLIPVKINRCLLHCRKGPV